MRDPRDIHCPACGARKDLTGRRDGEAIHVTCGRCGNAWTRYPDSCAQCGERSLVPVRVPLMQKARGTQQSIIGYGIAHRCTACGAESASAGKANDMRAT